MNTRGSSPLILVVDDEPDISELLKQIFAHHRPGYRTTVAASGREALQKAAGEKPDLILLDLALPDLDGFDVCRRLRTVSDVPIIVVSAKGRESDKVRGLELGADDYVTKPFGHEELVARVDSVLRRAKRPIPGLTNQPVLQAGDLRIDPNQGRVWRAGEEVGLTPTEFRLLYALVSHRGRVLPHRALLTTVWGQEYAGEQHYLKVYVNRLRQKLEPDPSGPQYLLTAWGVGYRFASEDELAPRTG